MARTELKQRLCLQCRKCCEYFVHHVHSLHDALGIEGVVQAVFADITVRESRICVVVFNPCEHLTDYGCSIYKDRPEFCRECDGRIVPWISSICLWRKGL